MESFPQPSPTPSEPIPLADRAEEAALARLAALRSMAEIVEAAGRRADALARLEHGLRRDGDDLSRRAA